MRSPFRSKKFGLFSTSIVSTLLPEKQESPILSTLDGILTNFSCLQPENANSPII